MKRYLYVLVMLACAPEAVAQDELMPISQQPNAHYDAIGVKAGAFMLRPALKLEGTYDDNIFRTPNNTESDFITALKPELVLQSGWDMHRIALEASGDIGLYADNSSENYEDYKLVARGRYDIAKQTWFDAALSYAQKHDARSDPNDVRGDKPTIYNVTSFKGGFTRALAKLKLYLSGEHRDINYENASRAGISIDNSGRDRAENTASAKAAYEFSPGREAFIRGEWKDINYDRLTNGVERSSDGFGTYAGLSLNLTGKMRGEVYGGYINRDFKGMLLDISAAAYGGSLLWNVSGLTSLQASVNRDVKETILNGASAYIRTGVDASIEHALRRNLFAKAALGYEKNQFEGSGRGDDVYSVVTGLHYQPFRGASIGAEYRYTQRDSNVAAANYEGSRFMLSARYEY